MKRKRPSLNTTFGVALVLLLIALAVILVGYQRVSEQAVEKVAKDRIRQTGSSCSEQVSAFLKDAETSLTHLRSNLLRPSLVWNEANITHELRNLMLYRPGLSEVTIIFPKGRKLVQLSLLRGGPLKFSGVRLVREGKKIVESRGDLDKPPSTWKRIGLCVSDPTQHATVTVFDDPDQSDVWSDLHYNPFDGALPESQRRITVSFQGSCRRREEPAVLRVGLATDDLANALVKIRPENHEVILCDYTGRPLVRPESYLKQNDNCFEVNEDDLRLKITYLSPPWLAALAIVGRDKGALQGNLPSFPLESQGEHYFGGAMPVVGGQEWAVVVLAPETLYSGTSLRHAEQLLLVAWCSLMVVVAGVGTGLKLFLRRDLDSTATQVNQLEDFLFSSSLAVGHFQETQRVLEVLEDAKTSLRGLSTYAPLNLVRQLHHLKSEPKLGGLLQTATVLFTDIAGFTSLSEQLTPNKLAELLGLYLEVVTECIHQHGGVVDKFIGDAAMALWNVPIPLPHHPLEACRAAWQILQETAQLADGPAWSGREAWVTRIGIHTDEVLVGHFGSPKRMNYTALGDGVNLASRLEGLNKQYASRILVSQAVFQEAHEEFLFCRIDRVAVVGKTMAVEVFQLMGPKEASSSLSEPVRLYEEALQLYFTRDFQAALDKLARVQEIGAANLLRERCKTLLIQPPPEDWDGVYRATKK